MEPLQCLGCSSVQVTSFKSIGFLSRARLAQSAERKALSLMVAGSSLTVDVGAFFNM